MQNAAALINASAGRRPNAILKREGFYIDAGHMSILSSHTLKRSSEVVAAQLAYQMKSISRPAIPRPNSGCVAGAMHARHRATLRHFSPKCPFLSKCTSRTEIKWENAYRDTIMSSSAIIDASCSTPQLDISEIAHDRVFLEISP